METITAIIEKAPDGGFCIYAANGVPLFGAGLSEQEARAAFESFVPEQGAAIEAETGNRPEWYDPQHAPRIEYRYDLSGFFSAFPFINATELAKSIGMNASQMRKYKSGIAKASPAQKERIGEKLKEIARQMANVKF